MSGVGGGDVPRLRDGLTVLPLVGTRINLMNRREFLFVAGAGAIGSTIAACAPDARYETSALARPTLLGALGPDVTRAIGAHYRAMTAGERNAESLRGAIMASRPWSARLTGHPPSVATLVTADFERGNAVVIDGWVLSATEARQCALFSLLTA